MHYIGVGDEKKARSGGHGNKKRLMDRFMPWLGDSGERFCNKQFAELR